MPAPDSPGMKGAEYASNNGRGPLVARIIRESEDGTVAMERWNPRAKHSHRTWFVLDKWFLTQSATCGWKRIGGGA